MRQQPVNRLTGSRIVILVMLTLSVASCGGGGSGSDAFISPVTPATLEKGPVVSGNLPPVAIAGPNHAVTEGTNVTLDGSRSYDPDHNTVLAFSWEIVSKPSGSTAALSDSAGPTPSFVADYPGTYVISLVVKDSSGLESEPAEVIVSTTNTPPVAQAGPDQSVRQAGQVVYLDGRTSYDADGDPLLYQWEITEKPDGSQTSLSGAQSSTSRFVADVLGDYSVRLTVTDTSGAFNSDTVRVRFSNARPVANAGCNQSVSLGDIVRLSAAGSYDADGDSLSFKWTIVSAPDGSGASLSGPNASVASFTADKQGMFVISLAVSDGLQESVSTVTITVTISRSRIMDLLRAAIDAINALAPEAFKNPNMKHTLTNKLGVVIGLVDQGVYSDAADKLRNDVLAKTDSCAQTGGPDQNDWIITCPAQAQIYPLLLEALQQL